MFCFDRGSRRSDSFLPNIACRSFSKCSLLGQAADEMIYCSSMRESLFVFLVFLHIHHGQHINKAMLWQYHTLKLLIKGVMVVKEPFYFNFVVCLNETDIL